VIFHEHPTQFLVRFGRPEEHPVRDDDSRSAARLQQPDEQRQEKQLGLFGLDDLLEILGDRLVVQRPGERWVREDERVKLGVPASTAGQGGLFTGSSGSD